MIDSISKVAYTFKKGQEVPIEQVAAFQHHGLPWFEPVAERFQTTSSTARITVDTEIEIIVKQKLGK